MNNKQFSAFTFNIIKSKNNEYTKLLGLSPFKYETDGIIHEVYYYGKRIFNSNFDEPDKFETYVNIRIENIIESIKILDTHIKTQNEK